MPFSCHLSYFCFFRFVNTVSARLISLCYSFYLFLVKTRAQHKQWQFFIELMASSSISSIRGFIRALDKLMTQKSIVTEKSLVTFVSLSSLYTILNFSEVTGQIYKYYPNTRFTTPCFCKKGINCPLLQFSTHICSCR